MVSTSPAGIATEPRRARARPLLAAAEVTLATTAVLMDWLVPALLICVLAAASLLVRREGPGSIGFHRPVRPWRLAGQMVSVAAVWSVVNLGLVIPVANRLTGQRQDMSQFADLQGNLVLLLVWLGLGWTVAALGEETAFRGYLLTRFTQVLGSGRAAVVTAVVTSSVLFGLLHTEQGAVGVGVTAVDAVVFSVLRLRCGTVWAPVLAHGFNNTIGFCSFFLFGPFYGLW